jgi:A/G-specific adenine glycosylase
VLARRIRPWIPEGAAGPFVEALIELGATVCRPAGPRCGECPIRAGCQALHRGEVDLHPPPRAPRRSVAITSARGVLRDGAGRVLVVRRPESASLLAGFFELPGRWLSPGERAEEAVADVFSTLGFSRVEVGAPVATARHVITRHRITSVAYEVSARAARRPAHARFVRRDRLLAPEVTTETRKLAAAGGAPR